MPAGFTGTRIGVCNLCEAICGLELTIERRRPVTGIRGNAADPLSRGYICPKGVSMADVHADPDRLRRPVRRVGEGADAEWEEIGWDEALDLVADRLARGDQRARPRRRRRLPRQPQRALASGSLTHGRAVREDAAHPQPFSATSVDQLPHQLVAWQLYGHQLLLPIPDIDRTVVLPGPRRQPDGLQRLADDGARLPAAAARPQGARRPDGRPRPAAHRDRQGGRPSTTSSARAPTPCVLLAMLHVLFEEGLDHAPGVRRPASTTVRDLVADFTPERAERGQRRRRPTTIRRLARELRGGRRRGGVRPDGRVDARASARSASGRSSCLNLLTGNLDREGGVLFTEPGDRRGRAPASSARGHHDVWRSRVRGLPGVRRRAARRGDARGDRDARRRPDPGDAHRRRQPGALHARRRRGSTGALRRPRLHGRGRHLPQRDHPARRRDPAADHARWSATTTTWSSTCFAVRNTARFTPAVLRARPDDAATTGRSSASSPCARAAG